MQPPQSTRDERVEQGSARAVRQGSRPLRILHLANHKSTNIGNGALVLGLERTLREDFGVPVEFVPEAWDDYTIPGAPKRFDARFVDLCNRHDVLLVGAAVTLVGSASHDQAGMRFDLPLPLWDRIRCPIVFYGLSYRTWPGEPYHHAEKLRAAVQHAVASERTIFSVRNDGTRDWLTRLLGIEGAGIHEVPDPAMFVPHDAEATSLMLASEALNVALSLNDEDVERRFAERGAASWARVGRPVRELLRGRRPRPGWRAERARFLERLVRVLDRLVDRGPVRIILCPHHHEDFRLIADFFARCSSRLKHQIAVVNGLPHCSRAAQFYNFYREVDLTLAMRVHALSPSLGLGTPTLALCSQRRMFAFMEDAGLADYAIDIFDEGFEQRLQEGLDRLLGDPHGARGAIASSVAAMRERTRSFNRIVEALVTAHVPS